jgi:hypothetical protein
MNASSGGPPGEPEDDPAQWGPLEQEINAPLYEEAEAMKDALDALETLDDVPLQLMLDHCVRLLSVQGDALRRLAREIDDLKAERGV